MNSTTTPKSPDRTREALLAAAFGEIHRHGFQAASLARILADTGLTKGALYHHFGDKKALGLAVVEELIRPRILALATAPLAEHDDPLAGLAAGFDRLVAASSGEAARLGCPLNNLMQEMSPLDEDFRSALAGVFSDWVGAVAAALGRGQAAGVVAAGVDPASAAFFIVSALEGCVGMSKNAQTPGRFEACLDQLKRYLATLRA